MAARVRLNPQFLAAVAGCRTPNRQLARAAKFAAASQFSAVLHSAAVVPSSKMLARLWVVAELVGFQGNVILDGHLATPSKRECFDSEHLPLARGSR